MTIKTYKNWFRGVKTTFLSTVKQKYAWDKFKHVIFNHTLPYTHKRLCPLDDCYVSHARWAPLFKGQVLKLDFKSENIIQIHE